MKKKWPHIRPTYLKLGYFGLPFFQWPAESHMAHHWLKIFLLTKQAINECHFLRDFNVWEMQRPHFRLFNYKHVRLLVPHWLIGILFYAQEVLSSFYVKYHPFKDIIHSHIHHTFLWVGLYLRLTLLCHTWITYSRWPTRALFARLIYTIYRIFSVISYFMSSWQLY
jgi:hypothetical protein